MLLESRRRARAAVMVATFDPVSRAMLLEKEEQSSWVTVALVFCGLLLFGFLAS